jgi:hypothetical protein
MSKGQHAAGDGSFPRSAGGAMARGIALIVVAVVLGVVLLRSTDSPADPVVSSGGGGGKATTTTSTAPPAGGSTTTTAPAAAAHDPSKVAILVANGTGGQVKGAAGRIAATLKTSNYLLKEATNTKAPAESSVVYFAAGYEPDARKIATLLTPQPKVAALPAASPVKDLAGANVLVVVAADLAAG